MALGILDTSTLILLGRLREPETLPAEPVITAITLAELSVGPLVASTDKERAARQAHVQQAEADFEPLPFDADAACVTITELADASPGELLLVLAYRQWMKGALDVDYAEAISDLERQLAGLEAAQRSYAQSRQLSLFDYL